jgi:hypothetical protein
MRGAKEAWVDRESKEINVGYQLVPGSPQLKNQPSSVSDAKNTYILINDGLKDAYQNVYGIGGDEVAQKILTSYNIVGYASLVHFLTGKRASQIDNKAKIKENKATELSYALYNPLKRLNQEDNYFPTAGERLALAIDRSVKMQKEVIEKSKKCFIL